MEMVVQGSQQVVVWPRLHGVEDVTHTFVNIGEMRITRDIQRRVDLVVAFSDDCLFLGV